MKRGLPDAVGEAALSQSRGGGAVEGDAGGGKGQCAADVAGHGAACMGSLKAGGGGGGEGGEGGEEGGGGVGWRRGRERAQEAAASAIAQAMVVGLRRNQLSNSVAN